ncbi:MAG: HEAT repeat domain-containing protein, partial [Beijerinckiaceae bacterium]
SGGYDDDAPWDAIRSLRAAGTREVFDTAVEWCRAATPLMRARGADVLAQLGVRIGRPHAFPEESHAVLLDLLQRESDPQPIASTIFALGHIGNPLSLPAILKFVSHDDAGVRFAMAYALGSFPNDPTSIACLLRLMSDPDDSVRDWATFSVGVLGDTDTGAIRDALVRRLEDPCQDARMEAMAGLGKRRDRRVLPGLISDLEQPEEAMYGVIEAAYLMLGLERAPNGWTSRDFAEALRERFRDE